MKLRLLLSVALIATLNAKSLSATKECEAFNNLKHTKNSGNVVVLPNKSYFIAREQKGNFFIKVEGAKPTMRWVNKNCFIDKEVEDTQLLDNNEKKNKIENSNKTINKATLNQNSNLESLLVLSWHNSFCETKSYKKECKRDGGEAKNRLVLHGLWPQPRSNSYCNVDSKIKSLDKAKRWSALPKLNLNSEVQELMQKYMPGSQSYLQRHEYYKHGTCYAQDANKYYKDALLLTKKVDSTLGEYLRANVGKKVNLYTIRKVTTKLLSKDVADKLAMKCKRGVLSEIWIPLKGKGSDIISLVKNAKRLRSNCKEAIVDAPGKFRR